MGTIIIGLFWAEFIVFWFQRIVALVWFFFFFKLWLLFVKVWFIVKNNASLSKLKGSVPKSICVMQTCEKKKSISVALLEPKWLMSDPGDWRAASHCSLFTSCLLIIRFLFEKLQSEWVSQVRCSLLHSTKASTAAPCHYRFVGGKQVWKQVHFLRWFAN